MFVPEELVGAVIRIGSCFGNSGTVMTAEIGSTLSLKLLVPKKIGELCLSDGVELS